MALPQNRVEELEMRARAFWQARGAIIYSGLALVALGIILVVMRVGRLIEFQLDLFGLAVSPVESGALASVFGLLLVFIGAVGMKSNIEITVEDREAGRYERHKSQ